MLRRLTYKLLVICLCLALPGCDEEKMQTNMPQPEAHNLTFTIQKSQVEPMTRALGTTEMDLDGVSSYAILLYKLQDGKDGASDEDWTLAKVINGDLTDGSSSTVTTQSFSVTASVDEGNYLAFAVANLPNDIDGTNQQYNGQDISTADKLKKLSFSWDDANKKIMFGTFYKTNDATFDDDKFTDDVTNLENSIDKDIRTMGMANVNPTDYPKANNDIAFSISKNVLQAHLTTKLYPMAALVTVYFDTYKLDPDVRIKINSITLKNVPQTCYLWSENVPGKDATWMADDVFTPTYDKDVNANGLADDEYIEYDPDPTNKYSHNTYNYGTIFFLYENRQGISSTTTLEGKKPEGDFQYATYVEVNATHKDNNYETPITYRYAIGEDAPKYDTESKTFGETILYNNYNVTRNRHYKVYFTFSGTGLSAHRTITLPTSVGETLEPNLNLAVISNTVKGKVITPSEDTPQFDSFNHNGVATFTLNNTEENAVYNISFGAATANSNNKLHLKIVDDETGTVELEETVDVTTGGWQTFNTYTVLTRALSVGKKTFTITFDSNNQTYTSNVNNIVFTRVNVYEYYVEDGKKVSFASSTHTEEEKLKRKTIHVYKNGVSQENTVIDVLQLAGYYTYRTDGGPVTIDNTCNGSQKFTSGEHMNQEYQYIILNITTPMIINYKWAPRSNNGVLHIYDNNGNIKTTHRNQSGETVSTFVGQTLYEVVNLKLDAGTYKLKSDSETVLWYLRLSPQ